MELCSFFLSFLKPLNTSCNIKNEEINLILTWHFDHFNPSVHPIVWPCRGTDRLICHVNKHKNKRSLKLTPLLFISLLAWTLVSSLRTTTCPFNIFLCNGNCSSTIISLHSLILCLLHACASHWLLCTVWSKLDVRSPHSHRETTSKTVAMGRIRKNHFGILTFSLLVTCVWTQR